MIYKNKNEPLKILDIGTGSGCLLLACLSELTMATGLGVDINPGAIDMAVRNCSVLGLDDRAAFVVGDFANDLAQFGCFDIILCNPPYIPSVEIATLSSEVALYDPKVALDGGADGLDCWRLLMPEMAKRLHLAMMPVLLKQYLIRIQANCSEPIWLGQKLPSLFKDLQLPEV